MSIDDNIDFSAEVEPDLSGTYTWSKASGPGGVTFSAQGSSNTNFSVDEPGVYIVKVLFTPDDGTDDDTSGDIVVIEVGLETYILDILRGEQGYIDAFIKPEGQNLTFQISGYNSSLLEVNYNSTLKQFDFTNLIQESDITNWADEQVVNISSHIPVINVGTVSINLKKRFNKGWEHLKDKGIAIASDSANYIGNKTKKELENKLKYENNHSPEIVRYLPQNLINLIGDKVRNVVNNSLVSIAKNVFDSVPYADVPQTIVPESTTWHWNQNIVLSFSNLTISYPDTNYTEWFNSIIDYGFDHENYDFQSAVANLTFNVNGITVRGSWGVAATTTVHLDKGSGFMHWSEDISFTMDF